HEVEAIVNSRPLTFPHASSGEQEVLTPAHFLTGKRLTSLPTSCEPDTKIDTSNDITRLWKRHQRQLDHFWTRWRREYLLQLRSAHESPNRQLSRIQAGDLVLIEEEKTPRHLWRTGRVQELFHGSDGVVRSCSVALPGAQVLKRPVQLVYPS
ncbi:uncharacterized protein LOC121837389, partial [Ixodes scapularis]|uniref:uncharacterized protein LOC121837389 n=1 Tax=Ixodes scapularis TaxID=6945 RepID=UPI001C391FFB